MATDETKQQAFEAIQQLALSGKKITKSRKLKEILDNIIALAKYQSDVIDHFHKKEKNK